MSWKIIISFIFLVGSVILFQNAAQAYTKGTELVLFEEIPMVTTATAVAQKITDAPAAMSVITSDDIARSGYTNLWDLLRSQPGVHIYQTAGAYAAVTLRGFGSSSPDKTQVLIDGRSVYSPLNAGVFWTESTIVLLEDIDRIEIMRGPNPILYGYNTVNGVINIITKDATKQKGGLAKATVGNHSTQQVYGRFGDTIGKLDYRLSAEKYNTWGLGGGNGHLYNDFIRQGTIDWRSNYHLNENANIELLTGIRNGPIGGQGTVGDAIVMDMESDFQQLKYNQNLSPDNSFYVQMVRNFWVKNYNTTPANGLDIAAKQFDIDAQQTVKLTDKQQLVWGGGWAQNNGRITSPPFATYPDPTHWYHDTVLRAFAQDGITINDKLTWYTGVEWANNNYAGARWSTRQTLMYEFIQNHTLRATYGRAYRAAGLTNTFSTANGRTSLKPESIDAYELGYRGLFMENKLSIDVQLFFNDLDSLITTVGSSDGHNINGNAGIAKGGEAAFEYKPTDWIKAYLNYSYIIVKDRLFAATPASSFNLREPKHMVNFGGVVNLKGRYLPDYVDTRVNWVDAYNTFVGFNPFGTSGKFGPYWKMDMKIAKMFMKDNLELALSGLNLLAPHHQEGNANVYIDRQVLGSVKVKF
jgi:iron complex outermembrane recepter protein